MCLESFQGVTVEDRPPEARQSLPFHCRHAVCERCDAQLRERGDGRCPVCRAERLERLDNDRREREFEDVSGARLYPDGLMVFPVNSPSSAVVRRAVVGRPEADHDVHVVQVTPAGRALLSALSNLASFNVRAFRELVADADTAPPSVSVARIRPHNP